MKLLWMIVGALMILFEVLTFGNLITVWFFFGAVGALIASYLTQSVIIQVLVFTITTIASLVLVRPIAKKVLLKEKSISTNADRAIGEVIILDQEITPQKWGQAFYSGTVWSCVSHTQEHIKQGEKVMVVGIEGVKLIVEKI